MGAGGSSRRSKLPANVVQPATECGPDKERAGEHSSASSRSVLSERLQRLETVVNKQAEQIAALQQTLESVQSDCRRTVSVLQYNILASYLGQNTQPWFLYGADITPQDRKTILMKYQERDANGQPKYSWPGYAEGILSPHTIARVEQLDEDFQWSKRKNRLVNQIRILDADVISLVELDQYEAFVDALNDTWESVFHKRPRAVSHDGCGVFWRRSKFTLAAKEAFDFVDAADERGGMKRDRSCLMVMLRWRACGTPLVVVSTHLAKNPDDRAMTAIRVRQVMQIMEGLTDFTAQTGAADSPVVLLGDLNARHFAEIRGLARTVWQVRGSPIHKFLWSATDVPTGPTSITKARQCRIDVVQFLSSQLEVMEVKPVPKLPPGDVIPNAKHPSDHFPVCVRFRLKDDYQKHKECARSWLECVAGREKLHPLTEAELLVAFEFFDRDRSSMIHRHDLEEACLELQCQFHVDVQNLLLDCFPDQQISYANFLRAYEVRLNHERMRCIGELESAFQFFANDSSHIHLTKLESVFREITPVSFSDEEVKEMIRRLELQEGQELVDVHRFCEVVCRATFPHKRRRKSTLIRECDVRAQTKELALRLDQLQRNISGWGIRGSLSPHNDSHRRKESSESDTVC